MNTIDADDIGDTVRTSLIVLDEDLLVQSTNRAFLRAIDIAPPNSSPWPPSGIE